MGLLAVAVVVERQTEALQALELEELVILLALLRHKEILEEQAV
jgi:hypothetical protein